MSLLHETQLLILEAIYWIGEPLSPSRIQKIYGGEFDISLGSFDYHCRRLAALGLLVQVERVQVRGAYENFYDLLERAG